MPFVHKFRLPIFAGLIGLVWLAGWVSFSAAAGQFADELPAVLQQDTATNTASATPSLTATALPTLTLTAIASATPASATPTLTTTVTPSLTPSPSATFTLFPSSTSETATPTEEILGETGTPFSLTPSPVGEITATATLLPLPVVTYQYPRITATRGLLALHSENAPAKGGGAPWLRCGWPLLVLALLWVGLAAWWLLAHAVTRPRD